MTQIFVTFVTVIWMLHLVHQKTPDGEYYELIYLLT